MLCDEQQQMHRYDACRTMLWLRCEDDDDDGDDNDADLVSVE